MSDIEIIEGIETTEGSVFEVEIFEAFPALGESNPELNHNKLNNRAISDQHPIGAITGLEKELEDIKALKTVYSDKIGVANYYKWDGDAAYDTFGYFVSLVTHNSTIKICDGGDIFGVTVGDAAFVGGQNQEIPRDNKYALVVTSGPVDVRCESDVKEGDYVVCNGRGEAKKTVTECGYKVIAINEDKANQYGTTYVTIALGVQACTTDVLGKNLQSLASRVGTNEQNIVSAINVANQAYNQSAQSTTVSEEAVRQALEAIKKADDAVATTDEMNNTLTNLSSTAAQARAIAESAVTSATAIKDEAIARANNAWAKAGEVATEVSSLCAKIDKYSVGEYSQAYGLTWEQTQGILKPGMIYVPTKHGAQQYHKEEYSYTEGEETKAYTRWFTPGYLYEWGKLAGDIYGWRTVGNNASITNTEDYSDPENMVGLNIGPWVFFATYEPAIHESWEYGYWYTDGEIISAKDGSTDRYEPYTLYKWENDHWVAVATLKGNVNSRMMSEVYQTTNEIMMGVINPRGGIAAFDALLDGAEATTQQFSEWKVGEESKMASVKTVTNEGDASVVISALQKDDENTKEMARLILNVAKDSEGNLTSALFIDANNINFEAENYSIDASKISLNGETTFATTEKDENGNDVTKIDGSHIATGSIKAEHIDANAITADKIAVDAITSRNYYKVYENGDYVVDENGDKVRDPDAMGMKLDLSEGTWDSQHFKVDKNGNITAAGGTIGDWEITKDGIEKRDISGDSLSGMYSGELSDNTSKFMKAPSLVNAENESAVRFYSGFYDGLTEKKELTLTFLSTGEEWQESIFIDNSVITEAKATSYQKEHSGSLEVTVYGGVVNVDSIEKFRATGTVLPEWLPMGTSVSGKGYSSSQLTTAGSTDWDVEYLGDGKIQITDKEKWGNLGYPPFELAINFTCSYSYTENVNANVQFSDKEIVLSYKPIEPNVEYTIPLEYTVAHSGHNFRVLEDGSLYANAAQISGHIEADSGNIGGLKIDNGIKGYKNSTESFSLTENGLLINSSSAKIEVGKFKTYYDTQSGNTYWQTDGPLYIQGMQSDEPITSIELMTDLTNNQETVNIYYDMAYTNHKVQTGSTLNDLFEFTFYTEDTILYPITYTVQYKTYYNTIIDTEMREHGSGSFSFTLDTHNKSVTHSFNYSATAKGISIQLPGGAWSSIMTDSVSSVLFGTITQKRANNNILITGNLVPKNPSIYSIGGPNDEWDTVYAATAEIQASDKNKKNTIENISEKYISVFDALKPVSYKFNNNTSDRVHIGFVAQDVKVAVENAGLTTQDFAAYCEWKKDDGTIGCGLRYSEFIALCVNEIQKLKKRVNELEEKLDTTK